MHIWIKRCGWVSPGARGRAAALDPETVASVAVIRYAALGDMVLTRPFLVETRRFFPNARITLVVFGNYTRGAPKDLADYTHVAIGSDRRDASIREVWRDYRSIGPHDIVFDLAAVNRSYLVTLAIPARLKVGFPYRWVHRALYHLAVPRSELRFETDGHLDLLRALGHQPAYPPDFALPGEPARRDRPYILYFTGASVPQRCWPATHFGDLVARLAVEHPELDHLVLEGIAPWETIAPALERAGDHPNVHGLRGVGLDESIAVAKGACLLVSNDTGIRHLAIAAGVPTVCLFVSSLPFQYTPLWGGHQAVFCPTGAMPDVEAAHGVVRTALDGGCLKPRAQRPRRGTASTRSL